MISRTVHQISHSVLRDGHPRYLSMTVTMDERLSAGDGFPKDSLQLLASLGLDTVPSREQTYREIEERLLLPKETLAEDWLSKYQVWVYYATLLAH
jgi:hypothetical protein